MFRTPYRKGEQSTIRLSWQLPAISVALLLLVFKSFAVAANCAAPWNVVNAYSGSGVWNVVHSTGTATFGEGHRLMLRISDQGSISDEVFGTLKNGKIEAKRRSIQSDVSDEYMTGTYKKYKTGRTSYENIMLMNAYRFVGFTRVQDVSCSNLN